MTLLSQQLAAVGVQCCRVSGPLLLKPDTQLMLQVEDTLLEPTEDGMSLVVLSNPTGRSCSVEKLGQATSIKVVNQKNYQPTLEKRQTAHVLTLQSEVSTELR